MQQKSLQPSLTCLTLPDLFWRINQTFGLSQSDLGKSACWIFLLKLRGRKVGRERRGEEGSGRAAYITFGPANALIEGEVCASPFIVMEGVANRPVTRMVFFLVTDAHIHQCACTQAHTHVQAHTLWPWPSASNSAPILCYFCFLNVAGQSVTDDIRGCVSITAFRKLDPHDFTRIAFAQLFAVKKGCYISFSDYLYKTILVSSFIIMDHLLAVNWPCDPVRCWFFPVAP